jgi:hypothetical protein
MISPLITSVRAAGRVLVTLGLTLIGLTLTASAAASAEAAAPNKPGTLVIKTVPTIAGAQFRADGNTVVSDDTGMARLPVQTFAGLSARLEVLPTQVNDNLKVEFDRMLGSPEHPPGGVLTVGLRTQRLITYNFVGPNSTKMAPERISRLVLRSNTGETVPTDGAQLTRPIWLTASRTHQTQLGLIAKDVYWTVDRVVVDGAEVVNRGQQKFSPAQQRDWTIKLLFFQVRVTGEDLLFGGTAGSGVEVYRPDGTVDQVPFVDGYANLTNLPRGNYQMRVYASGLSSLREVAISKDQEIVLEVITPRDMWIVGSALALVAFGLVFIGRRHHVRAAGKRLMESERRPRWLRVLVVMLIAGSVFTPAAIGGPRPEQVSRLAARAQLPMTDAQEPLLAYYYIWYNPTSWLRAKQDYPLLGRYSSADADVMRRHIEMAAAAGLSGFLVSWKHTEFLDPRLEQLVDQARRQDFKLGIVYQGLDFAREPLSAAKVAEDLRYFADRYATDPVFDLFGKPIVIITGTERYTVEQLTQIVGPVRDRLMVLASAKNLDDYQRTAALFEGDAYYWSSGDIDEPSYREKLERMGEAVHADGGMWLAPAAAGFDATDLGGRRVVDRENGETLRRAIEMAKGSGPDAIAIISWNEFSENSHIEPSELYGTTALRTLAEITGTGAGLEASLPMDSSEAGTRGQGLPSWLAIAVIVALALLLPVWAARRRRKLASRAGDGDPKELSPL